MRRNRLDMADPETCRRVRKVLVVRLDAIGDLLLSTPALSLVRDRFPNARIDAVVGAAGAAVLRGNPNVDRVIIYSAPWHESWRGGHVDWPAEAAQLWRVAGNLRAENYDAGFELRGDLRDIAFLAAALPSVLAGSGERGGAQMLDYDARPAPSAHRVLAAAAIAAAGAGPPGAVPDPTLYLTPVDEEKAEALLPPGSQTIALHLGAGFPSKQLPLVSFAEAVRSLRCADPSRRFVVVGGDAERPLGRRLWDLVGGGLCLLAGELTLHQTAAVLKRAQVFIGNDSAPMHLAAAVGTPVVACFGPSDPALYRPAGVAHRIIEVNLACRPCDFVHCVWPQGQRYQCMTQLDPARVAAAAEELLGRV